MCSRPSTGRSSRLLTRPGVPRAEQALRADRCLVSKEYHQALIRPLCKLGVVVSIGQTYPSVLISSSLTCGSSDLRQNVIHDCSTLPLDPSPSQAVLDGRV